MPDPLAELRPALAEKYRIERPLGSGGMATVYLATDLRHQRQVALKVLRPDVSAVLGADRFLHEIRVTASLRHPNILALFDSGAIEGTLYYVMPCAEGGSLRNRLQRESQLPVEEAVRIASEVAGALEYAHRHGLIHRDIKPENILFDEGRALVADFGLALAIQTAGGSRLTESGLALGTPQYMSPEQGAGDRILDARTDIYSLGCVTYEMLAGEPPHQGPTAQAIVARTMTEEPRPLGVARPTVPPSLAATVHRALQRSPADRYATAGEFAKALASGDVSDVARTSSPEGTRAGPLRISRPAAVLAATALIAGGVLLGRVALRLPLKAAARVAFYIETDSTGEIDGSHMSPLRISRDGRRIVYAARTPTGSVLLTRSLAEPEVHGIPGTEGASTPAISPDGDSVAFVANGALRKVPVAGGPVMTLTSDLGDVDRFTGLDWGPSGTLVYSTGRPTRLFLVTSAGNVPPSPIRSDSSCFFTEPVLVPDGHAVLARCWSESKQLSDLILVPVAGGPAKRLGILGTGPRFRAGRIFYRAADGTVWAQRFDPRRGTTLSAPALVGSAVKESWESGAEFDISESGTVVNGIQGGTLRLVIIGADHNERTILAADPSHPAEFSYPRFSPDGHSLVYVKAGALWVYSLLAGTEQRIASDGGEPTWSPDGKSIVYSGTTDGETDLWTVRADGQGGGKRLLTRPQYQGTPSFTKDGRWLLFVDTHGQGDGDIVVMPRTPEGQEGEVITTPFLEMEPTVSPDGRWLSYVSNESGSYEIYMQPFHRQGERGQVSVGGGDGPVWSGRGGGLLYRHGSQVIAVEFAPGKELNIARRRVLFDRADDLGGAGARNFDVAADGSTFAFITRKGVRRIAVTIGALTP